MTNSPSREVDPSGTQCHHGKGDHFAMRSRTRFVSRALGSMMAMFALAVLFHADGHAQQAVKFDSATISGLPARNLGSAAMSGRIAAVDAWKENGRVTVFVGSASGGVWKSVNGGTTFK